MRSETNNGTHNGTHKCYSYKRSIPISDILIRGVDCIWIPICKVLNNLFLMIFIKIYSLISEDFFNEQEFKIFWFKTSKIKNRMCYNLRKII